MWPKQSSKALRQLAAMAVVIGSTWHLWSDEPTAVKVSSFAPAEDLIQQVDFFLGRLDQCLANRDDFEGPNQSRVWKDSHTLSALALVLALHDQDHALKRAAPAVLAESQILATSNEDYERSRAALAQLKLARWGQSAGQPPETWKQVASLAALMKQVPLIHNGLSRGVEKNRLARQEAQSAGQAAALAAVAQVAMFDTQYTMTAESSEKWRHFCAEMRDAAGEINSAIHQRNQADVDAGMARLQNS
jgi:hypothetical protein